MAAVQVGGATLSIEHGTIDREGRDNYVIWIDLPNGSEHAITDMRSGCQGGTIQDGMASLLSFLGAAEIDPDGNEGLFNAEIVNWADANSDEISVLGCEIEETPNLVEE
jgi:hypothetical protein